MSKIRYKVYMDCLGGNERLLDYPEPDGCGFDDTVEGAKPKWFDSIEEAREFVEFEDEFIVDSNDIIIESGKGKINEQ